MIRGIDVSHYQGAVNWASLKSTYGLSFGAAKCTEGTGFTDSEFLANWRGMKSAGLARIAYHYARPEQSNAAAQALRLVNIAQPKAGDALCLDLEASALSQSQTNAWMRAFGQALRSLAPGVTTIAYLGGYAANGSGQGAVDAFDRWWYPRYASTGLAKSWPTTFAPHLSGNTTGWKAPPAPHLWQWTPNMNGRDANVSDLTVAALFGASTPAPTPTVKGEPMFIVSLKSAAEQYVSNGITRRWIPSPDYRAMLIAKGCDPDVLEFDTLAGMNAAGGTLYDPPTPDEIAAAIVALLPTTGAGLTVEQVKGAVRDVLVGGTAAVPA